MGKKKFKLAGEKQVSSESKWRKQEESGFDSHEKAVIFKAGLEKRLLEAGKQADKDFRLRIRRKKSTKGFRVVIYAPRKDKQSTNGDGK